MESRYACIYDLQDEIDQHMSGLTAKERANVPAIKRPIDRLSLLVAMLWFGCYIVLRHGEKLFSGQSRLSMHIGGSSKSSCRIGPPLGLYRRGR